MYLKFKSSFAILIAVFTKLLAYRKGDLNNLTSLVCFFLALISNLFSNIYIYEKTTRLFIIRYIRLYDRWAYWSG